MGNHGEIAYVVIIESYKPYTVEEYEKLCKKYGIEANTKDIKYVLDELIERDHLTIEAETGLISLNIKHSDMMDEMAYELQFNDEVPKKFANIINKHGDIDICFNYLSDISRIAFDETLKEMI